MWKLTSIISSDLAVIMHAFWLLSASLHFSVCASVSLSRWFMDILYQCWKQGSSVMNYSSPISCSGGGKKREAEGFPSYVCVCVCVRKKDSQRGGEGRQRLSQRSHDLIKAIHHIRIIRQRHGLHDQQPSLIAPFTYGPALAPGSTRTCPTVED